VLLIGTATRHAISPSTSWAGRTGRPPSSRHRTWWPSASTTRCATSASTSPGTSAWSDSMTCPKRLGRHRNWRRSGSPFRKWEPPPFACSCAWRISEKASTQTRTGQGLSSRPGSSHGVRPVRPR